MHSDWMIDVGRRLTWAGEAHGDAALSAAIWGFCFFMGALMAAGIVAACHRALRAWRARSLVTACAASASIDVEITDVAPPLPTTSPVPPPPPVPGRLLN